MQIPIKRSLERVPGGLMVVPLFLGAILHTLFPNTATFFGSFTGALFNGALPILAVFFVCMGAGIDFRATPAIARKGGVLLAAKVGIAAIMGVVFGQLLGEAPVVGGAFAGISTLAIVAAMNDTNGGLYLALMGQFGRPKDAGAYAIMSLESGPFLTMVTLGLAGLSAFPWPTLVGSILPLLIGMILGNLDRDMRAFLSGAAPVMIPFFAFALGFGLDLAKIWQAGLLGIGLGVAVVAITGAALFVADRLTGGNGVAGVAAASTATDHEMTRHLAGRASWVLWATKLGSLGVASDERRFASQSRRGRAVEYRTFASVVQTDCQPLSRCAAPWLLSTTCD